MWSCSSSVITLSQFFSLVRSGREELGGNREVEKLDVARCLIGFHISKGLGPKVWLTGSKSRWEKLPNRSVRRKTFGWLIEMR